MLKKYLLFLISVTIAVSMVTSTTAANYYVTLTISAFETAITSGNAVDLEFVQNSASPVEIDIYSGGSNILDGSGMTASRRYADGDTMTVGPVSLTSGNTYSFRITFDEVLFKGSSSDAYVGGCTTGATSSTASCKDCAGSNQNCPIASGNGYIASQRKNADGDAGGTTCDRDATGNTGGGYGSNCIDEILDALDEGLTAQFQLSFVA